MILELIPRKVSTSSHFVLAAILVALVGGAFWLKTRPKPASGGAPGQESTEALLARGIREHTAGSYDAAMEALAIAAEPNPPPEAAGRAWPKVISPTLSSSFLRLLR
ncbi:MAG: hypothetical protein ACREJ6_08995 [Candidatus Methylomirabilis sp.]